MLEGLTDSSTSVTSDAFVTRIQSLSTDELVMNRARISLLLSTEPTNQFKTKLRGYWMLGVYDRELKARNQ